jgi:hypothetical protein
MTDSLVVFGNVRSRLRFLSIVVAACVSPTSPFDPPSSSRRCRVFENVVLELEPVPYQPPQQSSGSTALLVYSCLCWWFVTVSETKIFAIFL